MSYSHEQPGRRFGIEDVASLLGVTTDDIPATKRQIDTLVELTEALLEKHGEKWIVQNAGVILDQWETILTLGIADSREEENSKNEGDRHEIGVRPR